MPDLYFLLSKIVGFFLDPLHLIAALVGLINLMLWSGAKRASMACSLLCLGLIGVMGAVPLWNKPLRALETQHAVETPVTTPAGLIVLGGALGSGFIAETHGVVPLNSAAERMTTALELMAQYPDRPLIFSGFSGRFIRSGQSESDLALQFFKAHGIATQRILLENQSRNTLENAIYTRELLDFAGDGPWILVTSAFHMPRAKEIFEDHGIEVIPHPTDFRSQSTMPWRWNLNDGASVLKILLHEWIGHTVYRLTQKPTKLKNH